jgi:hypothetical protein
MIVPGLPNAELLEQQADAQEEAVSSQSCSGENPDPKTYEQ